jgi:hypothetical protein
MTARTTAKTTAACLAGGAALAALGYAAYAAAAWTHYGHPARARRSDEEDPILDGFMPLYDIVERHHIKVDAPADLTLAAARQVDAEDSCIIRAVFRGRELMFGADPDKAPPPKGLLAGALAIGWGVLSDRATRSCSARSPGRGSRNPCSGICCRATSRRSQSPAT